MPTIKDVSIIDSNKAKAVPVKSGFERTICSPSLCGSKNLTVYRRTIVKGKQLDAGGDKDYHLLYVMQGSAKGQIEFNGNPTRPRKARACCSCRASPRSSTRTVRTSRSWRWSRRSRRPP